MWAVAEKWLLKGWASSGEDKGEGREKGCVYFLSSRYGDHLVLVANQELRETSLAPADMDCPLSSLSDMQYSILEVVGAARRLGVPRPFFAAHYICLDPRSVFHHVKILAFMGCLTIQVTHMHR